MLDDQGWDDLGDRIGDLEAAVERLRHEWGRDNLPDEQRLAAVREWLGRAEREVQSTVFWLGPQ